MDKTMGLFDVRKFGAKGDGVSLGTKGFQNNQNGEILIDLVPFENEK